MMEYREKLKLLTFLEYLDFQDSQTGSKIIDFAIEYSSIILHFSIYTLIEGIQLVVTEQQEFEFQDKSI